MITFCCRREIFFHFPRLFSTFNPAIAEVLKKYLRPLLTFRWEMEKVACRDYFGWIPSEVVTAISFITDKGEQRTVDVMAEKQTEGNFCQRASNFGDTEIPSSTALEHRAIKASLI